MWLVKHRLAKSEKKRPLPWIRKNAKKKGERERKSVTALQRACKA